MIQDKWIILIVVLVILCTLIFVNKDYISENVNTSIIMKSDKKFEKFEKKIIIEVNKKLKVYIDQEQFNQVEIPECTVLYYFPEDCPTFKDDKFIKVTKNGLENFYLPEKNCLLLIPKEHVWTKEPGLLKYWKR